jgi:hypothetical protein
MATPLPLPDPRSGTARVAFAIGVALVVAPWVGAAALVLASGRRWWRDVPRPIVATALLMLAASGIVGRPDLGHALQVLAVAVVVAAGRQLGRAPEDGRLVAGALGLAAGLLVAAVVAGLELGPGRDAIASLFHGLRGGPAANQLGRAAGWWSHPNLWGAMTIAPVTFAVAVALRWRRSRWVLAALPLGLVVVMSSGSRAALAGVAIGVAGAYLAAHRAGSTGESDTGAARARPRRLRRLALRWVAALAAVAVVVLVAVAAPGRLARLAGPPIGASEEGAASRNLFASSEDLADGVWWAPQVGVERFGADAGGAAVHALRRPEGRWTDRIQQRVALTPGRPYTLSLEWGGPPVDPDPVAAVVGWARVGDEAAEVVVRLPRSGDVTGRARGPIDLVELRSSTLEAGWRRVEATLVARTAEPLALELGIAPRSDDGVDPAAATRLRRLQLELGAAATAYAPTGPPDRTRLMAAAAVRSREALYAALLERVGERPWLGWGGGAYATVRALEPGRAALAPEHEHSLPLWFALRYGVVGVVAWMALVVGMAGRSGVGWAIVAAVMAANLVDLTFLSPAVYASTAALAGLAGTSLSDVGGPKVRTGAHRSGPGRTT